MVQRVFFTGLTLFLFLGLIGCDAENPTELHTPVLESRLTPYWTPAPSQTQDRDLSKTEKQTSPTIMPSPTPTPVIYEIVEGDTLTSIAFRHGIKLNNLLAVNPDIDPNFLTIGITITIPTNSDTSSGLPSPTPIPVTISDPICYPTREQGLWCMFIVENNQSFPVESVAGIISLTSPEFEGSISQEAIPLLNILRPDQRIPLTAYFPPKILGDIFPEADIRSLLPVQESDRRYLNLEIKINETIFSSEKSNARVEGEIRILDENTSADLIWLAVIAYDDSGHPVGIRKWIASTPLSSNQPLSFDIIVFSLGPPIEEIEILGEAHPLK